VFPQTSSSNNKASNLDELEEVQLLSLHGKYPLALAMTTLPQSKGFFFFLKKIVPWGADTILCSGNFSYRWN
jgi:hypothetical protein